MNKFDNNNIIDKNGQTELDLNIPNNSAIENNNIIDKNGQTELDLNIPNNSAIENNNIINKNRQTELDLNVPNDSAIENNNMDLKQIMKNLDAKYPLAKIDPSLVHDTGLGLFSVEGRYLDLEGLDEYIKKLNDLEKPYNDSRDYYK